MYNLDDVTVFSDLRERLSRVTPQQIRACARRLRGRAPNDGKNVLGVITSTTTQALFTLFRALRAEEEMERASATGADDEIKEKEHLQKARLLDAFADVMQETFWAQVQVELGTCDAGTLTLREGWIVVRGEDSGALGFAEGLAEILRGRTPR